jgi:hypothetical protein
MNTIKINRAFHQWENRRRLRGVATEPMKSSEQESCLTGASQAFDRAKELDNSSIDLDPRPGVVTYWQQGLGAVLSYRGDAHWGSLTSSKQLYSEHNYLAVEATPTQLDTFAIYSHRTSDDCITIQHVDFTDGQNSYQQHARFPNPAAR